MITLPSPGLLQQDQNRTLPSPFTLQKKREKTCCNKTKIEGNDSSVVPFFAIIRPKQKAVATLLLSPSVLQQKKRKKGLS
jgi:hypothetical protein